MWKVLSLYRSGKLHKLFGVTQDYKIDFLAIQEVGWLGGSIREKDCRMYYSCDDEENIFKQSLLLVNISDQE